jgi:hypothetical protein
VLQNKLSARHKLSAPTVEDWKSPLHLQAGWHPCPRQQEENLTEVCEEEVCPPSSLDCNPFDYFVWGVSEL